MKIKKTETGNKIQIYAIVSIIITLLYWGMMVLLRSSILTNYFVTDCHNTYMDYYNMLANLYDADHPYSNNSNYPAMCFLIWRVLFHMIPINQDAADGFYLRNYMPATLGFILCSIFVVWLTYEALQYMIKGEEIGKKLLAFSIIVSGPYIFALERGNIIVLSFALTLIFVALYKSEKKYLRIVAYICLAVAASIKIYPALFGLLMIKKSRIKEIVFTVALGIITFIMPFFAFEGIKSVKDFLHGIRCANILQGKQGTGLNYSLDNLTKIIENITKTNLEKYSGVILACAICFCLIIIFCCRHEWQRSFGVVLLIMWVPKLSYTYMLLFFSIPLIQFLNENGEKRLSCLDIGVLMSFMVIQVPLALPSLGKYDIENAKFPLSWSTLLGNLAILFIAVAVIVKSSKEIINSKKKLINTL